jgi:putative acetyltransferase
VIVREANRADASAIRLAVTAAFGRPDEAVIVDQVRTANEALAEFVAEVDGEVAGHVLLNQMRCRPPMIAAGLGPLAVAPAFQGLGIGSALVRRGLDACRELGARACVVLGAPAYYGRFGFISAGAVIKSKYSHLPSFQALAFDGGALTQAFSIAYPDAFD